jgi:hypothetical protein
MTVTYEPPAEDLANSPTVTMREEPVAAPAPVAPAGLGAAPQVAEAALPQEPEPAPPVVRRAARRSMLVPTLLIFLIPYAIVSTIAVVVLLAQRFSASPADPLERMLDIQEREKEAPRRIKQKQELEQIKHDLPLPDKLKTALGQTLRVGVLEVRPFQVGRTEEGDLLLALTVKNVSPDQEFCPISARYLEFERDSLTALKPFTYLQFGATRVYGGDLRWTKVGPEKGGKGPFDPDLWSDLGDRKVDGLLRPGQSLTAVLLTDATDRKKLTAVGDFPGALWWRVQVRRGLERVRGREISTTAVVGVQFRARDIRAVP